jgi:hypothetical protein
MYRCCQIRTGELGMEIFAILTVGAILSNWWAWKHR